MSSREYNPTAWDCGTCPHRNFCRFRKPCFVSGADAQRVPAQCHAMVLQTGATVATATIQQIQQWQNCAAS